LLEQPVAAEKPKKPSEIGATGKVKINSNFGKDGYLTAVRKAKEYIRAGDVFQVVISQPLLRKNQRASFRIYSQASSA